MIRTVARLISYNGRMPTIDGVRRALGNIYAADRWVADTFGSYEILFRAARTYRQLNPPPVAGAPAQPIPVQPVPPPPPVTTTPPRSAPVLDGRSPAYPTVEAGLAALLAIGVRVTDPVAILILSRSWRTPVLPHRLPTWEEWRTAVQQDPQRVVPYFQSLAVMGGGRMPEALQYMRISYHRIRTGDGQWVLDDLQLKQSDDLESLVPPDMGEGEGHIWLCRRKNFPRHEVLGAKGDGVEELELKLPDPPPAGKKGTRVQYPDAEVLIEASRRLRELLSAESYGSMSVPRPEPLFTPAEWVKIAPLVNTPVEMRHDMPGFAPTPLTPKDLAIPPSEWRLHSPSPSRGEGWGEGDSVDLPATIGGEVLLPEPPLGMVVVGDVIVMGGFAMGAALVALGPELWGLAVGDVLLPAPAIVL